MIEVLYPFMVLGILGILMGVTLSFASKHLEVVEDPRIDAVEKLLPGYNCGACGTPGCHAFADGIINGEVKNLSRCRPGKADKHFNPILEYLKENPNTDGSIVNVKI